MSGSPLTQCIALAVMCHSTSFKTVYVFLMENDWQEKFENDIRKNIKLKANEDITLKVINVNNSEVIQKQFV